MASSTPHSRVGEFYYSVSVGKEVRMSDALDLECTIATRKVKEEIDKTDQIDNRGKRQWSQSIFKEEVSLVVECPDNDIITVQPNPQQFFKFGRQKVSVMIKTPSSLSKIDVRVRYGDELKIINFSFEIKQGTVQVVHGSNACVATPTGDNLHDDSGNYTPETMEEINAVVGRRSLAEQTPTGRRTGARSNRVLDRELLYLHPTEIQSKQTTVTENMHSQYSESDMNDRYDLGGQVVSNTRIKQVTMNEEP